MRPISTSSSPGPVFVRTERYLNGQASVSSAALKLGGDYDFKIVLKARLPGRYHLHPFFNLHDAGAVMGPGHWFEVAGDPAAFTNQVKTLNGDVIDMETYGLANGIGWHAFWFALGAAWLLWWVRRPLFIPRYKMLQSGQEKCVDHAARQDHRHGHPGGRAVVRSWRQRDDG